MTGTIKTMHADKGYGFIRAEDGKDYFFHRDDINGFWDEFKTGGRVTFEPVVSQKGPRASNVMLVNQYDTDVE